MTVFSLSSLLQDPLDTVVIAASDGAARQRREQLLAAAPGSAFLERVEVLPLEQWLVALWDNSFPERQVLRPVQVLALARQVVAASGLLPPEVLSPLAVVRRFVDAFETAARFGLMLPETGHSPEQRAFAQWRAQLLERMQQQGALSAAQLPQALYERLAAGQLELPQRLVLDAALELTGPEQQLLDALARAGVTVATLAPEPDEARADIRQLQAATVAEEIDAAARWVGALLRQSDAGAPPRIALVVPDAVAWEAPLRRALERHAYPPALFPSVLGGAVMSEPWRIGGGRLAGYPVIAIAMELLEVAATGDAVPLEQLSRILRSSFVAETGARRSERARLDLHWREQLPGRVTLRQALRLARRSAWPAAAEFFEALAQAARSARGAQLPSAWVRQFDAELLAAGWPNREAGDAVVDQCRRGFSQVMDTLRALDRQLGDIGRDEALFWLRHILQGKRFELNRDSAVAVHILTLDDAAGQRFDALWLLGLSDNALPRPPEVSPYLPRETVIAAGVPRSEAEDCLRRDHLLLQHLLRAAPQVNLSCAAQSAEGIEQGACTMLDWQWPPLPTSWPPGFEISGFAPLPLTDTVQAVGDSERAALRGGTSIFRDYAISPFAAFLRNRLGLRAFPLPQEGLDAATQGVWVHAALELFWRDVQDSDRLRALDDAGLEALLQRCIDSAMASSVRDHGDELLRIERRRLLGLLQQWLAFERERNEAFTVEACELGAEISAWRIPIRVRIDRVDRIGEHHLIIDYKTGNVQANKLNAENLLEPQLPLYALFGREILGTGVDGVALAQVHARNGMSAHVRSNWTASLVARGRPKNPVDTPEKWRAECDAWQKTLQQYAEGFLAGTIEHDFSLGADDFPYDPYVITLARAEVLSD